MDYHSYYHSYCVNGLVLIDCVKPNDDGDALVAKELVDQGGALTLLVRDGMADIVVLSDGRLAVLLGEEVSEATAAHLQPLPSCEE